MDQLWTVALLLLRNAFTFCGPGEGTGTARASAPTPQKFSWVGQYCELMRDCVSRWDTRCAR